MTLLTYYKSETDLAYCLVILTNNRVNYIDRNTCSE